MRKRLPNFVLSAPVHMRIGAFVVDYALIGGLLWCIHLFLGRAPASYEGFRSAANSLPGLLVMWLYFAFMESSKFQATAGKLVFRLRVCDYRFERISFLRAVFRFLARTVLGIWILVIMFTNSMQSIHDVLTQTIVLTRKDLASHRRNRERHRVARAFP